MTGSGLRILVTGLIAQYPLGGVTWDYVPYPTGLSALGHDVYYIEDTGEWPYNPLESGTGRTADYNIDYLSRVMSQFGLGDRWAYRFAWTGQWAGLAQDRISHLVDSADLVINVSGVLNQPDRYRSRGRLVYIDTDPVFTQIRLARDEPNVRAVVDAHDITFSFGETLPDEFKAGKEWLPTRQPVLLDRWGQVQEHRDVYTTVMNWTSYESIDWGGRVFGQKDLEMMRFIDLPGQVDRPLEIAMATGKTKRAPMNLLMNRGWGLVDPASICPDPVSYRNYLQASKAEWSVAKNGYVIGRAGWFSGRSACYLAAGRPVVVQDTGFSEVLPVGSGIIAFDEPASAVAAIEDVEHNYQSHSDAAVQIAREYFDSRHVLIGLLERSFATDSRAENPV